MRIFGYTINLPELPESKYFKPKSVTWWVGVFLFSSGVFRMYGFEMPVISDTFRPLIDTFYKNSDPGTLITSGLGLIGLRGALPVSTTKIGYRF